MSLGGVAGVAGEPHEAERVDDELVPELAESLLGCGKPIDDPADLLELPEEETPIDPPLTVDNFRAVVRELFTRSYQEI